MENKQTNTQTIDPNIGQQYQPNQSIPATNYWKIATIVLSVLMVILVSGGIYILGNNQQKNISSLPTPTTSAETNKMEETNPAAKPTTIPSVANVINWKTQTISIQHEDDKLGKQTFTIGLKIPSDWNIQTYPRQADSNYMIKNCSDYIITSPTVGLSMTLSPICSEWVSKHSSWPINAFIVQQKQNANDGSYNYYRVRYTTTQNNYSYVDGTSDLNRSLDKSQDQVMDAISIGYAPPNESKNDFFFIPAHLTATYHPASGEEEKYLSIADQIASSLNLL